MLSQTAIKAQTSATMDERDQARVTRLSLTDFRSYARADIAFDGRPVAIAGANGSGKTNILEAISLMGPGRGIRSARLDELPRVGGDGGWAVSLRVADSEDERRFGVGANASRPDRRVCRIDEGAASGPGAFVEHLRFVWLTPAQDRLFMEGASDRRRFLDRMTLAHDATHSKSASAYEKAMRQRQRLLDEGGRDASWLSALESQMAEAGVAIAAGRRETVRLLGENSVADDAPFPAADLALDGEIENALAGEPDDARVVADFAEMLAGARRRDAEAGRALTGPHRSDLVVAHREKAQPARLCSTGEQKALLIGLVLANASALARRREAIAEATPLILLLDEIAAHLDPDRRAALFEILDGFGFQSFMTGTDKNLFTAWGSRVQYFEMENGAPTEVALT